MERAARQSSNCSHVSATRIQIMPALCRCENHASNSCVFWANANDGYGTCCELCVTNSHTRDCWRRQSNKMASIMELQCSAKYLSAHYLTTKVEVGLQPMPIQFSPQDRKRRGATQKDSSMETSECMKAKNVVHSSAQEQDGTPLSEKHSSQESHKCVKARSVVQVSEPELISPPLSGAPMQNTSEVTKNEDESDWTLPLSTVKPSDEVDGCVTVDAYSS